MNKKDFLATFQRAMDALGVSDQAAHYAFFAELFDDMAEEGVSEAEISSRLGDPWELAASLLREEMGTAEDKDRGDRSESRSAKRPSVADGLPGNEAQSVQNSGETAQDKKNSAKWSWRDGLHRLLDSAGIKAKIGVSSFGHAETFETTVAAAGISELEIHWMAGELQVTSENRGDILLTENRSVNAAPMWVEVRGSCLCVFSAEDSGFHGAKELAVTLPYGLANDLHRCTIQAMSADTALEGLQIRELSVKTASGQQEIRVSAERAVLSSASGDLELELDAKEITAETSSGDLDLTAEDAELIKLSTASGDICVHGSAHRLSMNSASGDAQFSGKAISVHGKTASGDYCLDLDNVPDELNISSVSGDLELSLPHGAACQVQLYSRTGDVHVSGIRTDVPDAPTYRLQTVSGDIDVHD